MIKLKKGFTLIELLVVIGILAILLAITLIAIARQFGQANNTRRRSDILQILNAIHQYVAENKGQLPPALKALAADTATPVSSAGLNICADLMPNYIPALPTEPSLATAAVTDCTTYTTGYQVTKDAQNRITVSSPVTDNGEVITVTR